LSFIVTYIFEWDGAELPKGEAAVLMRVFIALSAALIFGSVTAASAATIHTPVRHDYYYQHSAMLTRNNQAALTYWQNEANTEAAIRFQEQWDNSY
jgi:hypothetical protein